MRFLWDLIIRIVDQAPYHRMIHVVFGNRVRRYSECYGASDILNNNQRGLIAQWLEQSAHNGLVAGSNPAEPTKLFQNNP